MRAGSTPEMECAEVREELILQVLQGLKATVQDVALVLLQDVQPEA